jgi:hypothetical protein
MVYNILLVFYNIIEVYHMLQDALEHCGHYNVLHMHLRGEDHVESNECRGLDGYSFFGLNIPNVVNALEYQENSIYHAIPPPGYIKYCYHLVQPKQDLVIKVNEERVIQLYNII